MPRWFRPRAQCMQLGCHRLGGYIQSPLGDNHVITPSASSSLQLMSHRNAPAHPSDSSDSGHHCTIHPCHIHHRAKVDIWLVVIPSSIPRAAFKLSLKPIYYLSPSLFEVFLSRSFLSMSLYIHMQLTPPRSSSHYTFSRGLTHLL